MSKEYFTDKSYASWLKQFKVFEDGKAFRNALEAVTSGRKPTDRNVRSSDCTSNRTGGVSGSSDHSELLAAVQALNGNFLAAVDAMSYGDIVIDPSPRQ